MGGHWPLSCLCLPQEGERQTKGILLVITCHALITVIVIVPYHVIIIIIIIGVVWSLLLYGIIIVESS